MVASATGNGRVFAVQHIRAMHGGSQAHLLRASDGRLYVVKFQNNPQTVRVLANEYIATRLAEHIGLPVPKAEVIQVHKPFVTATPELRIELPGQTIACAAGLQFASCLVGQNPAVRVSDVLSGTILNRVHQLNVFAGALVLDKWLCNVDGRQVIFWRRPMCRKYRVTLIDQGYCLGGADWTFRDAALHGAYHTDEVYTAVTGWDSFEPWLSNAEQVTEDFVWATIRSVPEEWYGADQNAITALAEQVCRRTRGIRALLMSFANSCRHPFLNWRRSAVSASTGPESEFQTLSGYAQPAVRNS